MQAKDFATLVLSALALCVSVAAFLVSYIRGQREQRRAIRQQLTETINKITESDLERIKLMYGDAKDNVAMQQSVSTVLGQRLSALLDHAVYLTIQIPSLATPVDYNTIAFVSSNTGDPVLAETNYRKAIGACTNDFVRSPMTRSFGYFLFTQRRFEEGRKAFLDAATLIKGSDNSARAQKGQIYLSWGWCEQTYARASNQAADAFENASGEFTGIDNEGMRQIMLARLEHARRSPVPPTTQMPPRRPPPPPPPP